MPIRKSNEATFFSAVPVTAAKAAPAKKPRLFCNSDEDSSDSMTDTGSVQPPPSLEEVLRFQNFDGYFLETGEKVLLKFLTAASKLLIQDLLKSRDKRLVLTLVALAILSNRFEREKKEWTLVA